MPLLHSVQTFTQQAFIDWDTEILAKPHICLVGRKTLLVYGTCRTELYFPVSNWFDQVPAPSPAQSHLLLVTLPAVVLHFAPPASIGCQFLSSAACLGQAILVFIWPWLQVENKFG